MDIKNEHIVLSDEAFEKRVDEIYNCLMESHCSKREDGSFNYNDLYNGLDTGSEGYKKAVSMLAGLCEEEFPKLNESLFGHSDYDLFFSYQEEDFKVYYYNPDSSEGGQIVECYLWKDDLEELAAGEELMQVIEKYTQYLSDINTIHFFEAAIYMLSMKRHGLFIGTDQNLLCEKYLHNEVA